MEYLTPGERERRAAAAEAATVKRTAEIRAEQASNYQQIFDLIPQLVAAGYPYSSLIEKVVPVPPGQIGDWPKDHLYRLEHKPGIPRNVSKREARRLAERPPIVTIWGITEVIRCWIILRAKVVPDTSMVRAWADSKPEPRYSSMTITEELTVPNKSPVNTLYDKPPSARDGLKHFEVGWIQAYPRDCLVPLSSVLSPEETSAVDTIRRTLMIALRK
jgi:hypothetical protein